MTNWLAKLAASCQDLRTSRESEVPINNGWHRIAVLRVDPSGGTKIVKLQRGIRFRLIKLRACRADVEVYRWTVEFEDGTTQELPVRCLFDWAESRPLMIHGGPLKHMVVEHDTLRALRRGQLEVWAQS